MSDVTRIIDRVQRGDPNAADELLPLVYEELDSHFRFRGVIGRRKKPKSETRTRTGRRKRPRYGVPGEARVGFQPTYKTQEFT